MFLNFALELRHLSDAGFVAENHLSVQVLDCQHFGRLLKDAGHSLEVCNIADSHLKRVVTDLAQFGLEQLGVYQFLDRLGVELPHISCIYDLKALRGLLVGVPE